MNFVTNHKTAGVKSKEIPCLTGAGAPTTTTAGAVGCLYIDVLSEKIYKCTAASGGVYVWKQESITVSVTAITGGHRVTITDSDGIKTFDVLDGANGDTPQKGIDYFTEADKQELVTAVLAALPNGDEVSY